MKLSEEDIADILQVNSRQGWQKKFKRNGRI